MAGLHFDITADNRTLLSTLEESRRAVNNAMKNIEDSGMSIENVFHRIERAAALSVAGFSLKGVIDQAIQTRSYFEDIESSMRVFLGSEEKAVEFTKKLQDAAYYNMFEFADLADASKQLIAYRNDVNDVIPIINKLSEVAVATKTPLAEMVSLYNRAKSTGTVDSHAIQSWATKGLVLKDVMKDLGVVTAGTSLSFEQLNMALDHVTGEGGMFHGIQDSMMENLSANIGQLEDNLSLMFNDIGSHLQGVANVGIKAAGDLVDHWQEALAVIATIATSYGVNKAVEVGGIAINKASTSYGYEVELEQLRALLPAKEKEEESTLQQAVASGRLSEAKAKEIQETRQQVDAILEELTAKEALAKTDKEVADTEVSNLEDQIKGLDERIEKAKEYMDSLSDGAECLEDLAEMEEYEAAMDSLCSLERERNSAENELNSATERQNAAARNLTTASTNRETLATQINSAQTAGNTAAKDALTIASNRLRVAMDKLNKVIEANKFAILTAALLALGAAIYKICTYESDFTKKMNSANDAAQSQEKSMREEISTLNRLKTSLESAKKGSAEWKSAKETIISQFGKYHEGLDSEIEKTGILAKTYDSLTKSIRLSAAARAMEKFRNEHDNKEEIDEFLESIRRDLSGKNFKIGADGEIDRTDGLKFVKVVGDYQEKIMQKVFDWIYDGDLSRFTPQDLGYLNQTGAFSYHAGSAGAKRIRENIERNKEFENTIAQRYGTTVDEIDGRNPLVEDAETTLKEAYDSAKKAYEDQKAIVVKMGKDRASYTAKAYEDAVSKLKDLKAEFEKYGGQTKTSKSGLSAEQTASKIAAEQRKILDLMKNQHNERLKLQQEYEYQAWQNRIDLMDEGEAKTLAQMKLDHNREQNALEEQKKQAIEAEISRQKALWDAKQDELSARNKGYGKQIFNGDLDDKDNNVDTSEISKITERYESLYSQLLAKQKKAESDRLDAAKESMNAYLKEFGNYQQKCLAIEQEYEKKIAEAPNRGERKIAMAQRDKAYADLDFNEWQENGGMTLAFGDISRLSKETVTQLISDMEKYRSKIIATFDPDKIQKFEDALANLRSANIDFGFTFSDGNDILDSMRERLALQQQIADAAANETALMEQKRQIESELAALNAQIFAGGIATAATDANGEKADDATVVNEDMIAQADALRVKLDAVSRSLEKSSRNSQQLQSQLRALGKVKFADIQKFSNNLLKAGKNAADLASIFSDDVADAIQTGADKVGVMLDAFTELSSNIELLAKAGKDAVKDTADATKDIVDATSEGMEASAAATATSLSTMEKASAILAIIGAAIQLATMIASLFNSDKKHEKNIKKLQEQIDALQNSYDKLGRKIDEAYSTDASKLIGQQDTLLRQQKQLVLRQWEEEFNKKKTDEDKLKEYKKRLDEIDEILEDNKKKAKEAIIGEDLKSAINEFASLYAEAWNDGTDAAQKSMAAVKSIISSALSEMLKKDIQPAATRFYDALAEAMKDGVLTDAELANLDAIKREMDALAAKSQEQWEMIQNRYKDLDELKEELTDISFDSVRDNFKSLLSDMESTTADFTDSFSDMLRNALLEGLMRDKYDLMLKEWYGEFAEAMNDKTLTDSERDALRQQYDAIVQQGLADRDFINSIVGGGAYSQEATKGGWGAMSQDTGDELNGRFTALTELSAISNTLSAEQNLLSAQILETLRSMSGLTMVSDGDNSAIREIRDMMFLSTGHLEDIAKYTKQLYDVNTNLSELRNLIDKRL